MMRCGGDAIIVAVSPFAQPCHVLECACAASVVAVVGVVVVVALAAILVEVAVLVVFGVIIEKKWLDLCGGERVLCFYVP